MSNQQIKTNLETLLAAVEAQPETNFHLDYFKKEEPCGTLFCTVGLACTMPKFQEMGFHLQADYFWGLPSYTAKIGDVEVMGTRVADPVFGYNAYHTLFSGAGDGEWDVELGYDDSWDDDTDERRAPDMTHKELAIARLKKQIQIYSEEQ